MKLRSRSIVLTALGISIAAVSHAQTYGQGGADDQLDVLSVGSDISMDTILEPFYIPSDSGTGFSNYAVYTNGTDYFNVNSYSQVPGGTGIGYEEAGYIEDIFFINEGSAPEAVTVSWEGFATASVYSSGSPAYSWDYADAWVYVVDPTYGTIYDDSPVQVVSYGGGSTSGNDYNSATITFLVPGGGVDYDVQLQTVAYNESYSTSTGVPGPAAVAPFLIGLAGAARKRRNRLSR
jgi:hypothetical protein